MDYTQYDAADFASDDLFIRWVTRPDTATDQFWAIFLAKNPTQAENLAMARQLVKHFQQAEQPEPVEESVDTVWKRLETTINQPVPVRRLTSWWPYSIAASVLLVLGISWWLRVDPAEPATFSQRNLSFQLPVLDNMAEVRTETQPTTIRLMDGSVVQLAVHSQFRYPKVFTKTQRDVFLTGEAFFEVVRRPEQPFFVHTDALVTKVLGTSFQVRAYQTDPTVTVDVRTGRVSVYAAATPAPDKSTNQALVLIPNQKAIYVRADDRLTKTITGKPVPIATVPNSGVMAFDDTPVAEVLTALERLYGIAIVYDATALANCTITTNLTTEPLFDKLTIVCKAIGATYHEEQGQILVNGPGCR